MSDYQGKHHINVYKLNEGGFEMVNNAPIIDILFTLVIRVGEEMIIKTKDGKQWRLKYSVENQRMELSGKPFDDRDFTWGTGWIDCIRALSHLDIETYQVDVNTTKHTTPKPSRESMLARNNIALRKEVERLRVAMEDAQSAFFHNDDGGTGCADIIHKALEPEPPVLPKMYESVTDSPKPIVDTSEGAKVCFQCNNDEKEVAGHGMCYDCYIAWRM